MSFRKVIWKWQVPASDYFVIELPKDAQIINFGNQHNMGCLWAIVDPDEEKPKEKRAFRLIGTGHEFRDDVANLKFIGTFVAFGAHLVLHLFEILNASPEDIAKYEVFNRVDIDDPGNIEIDLSDEGEQIT